jgi:hypothetical protein
VLVDSSNKYWSISDASQTGLDVSTTATFCAYLYNTNTTNHFRNKNWISKGAASNYSYNVGWSDSSPFNYQIYSSAVGAPTNTDTLASSLSDNTWYEVCAVYTGASSQMEMFVNGSSVGTMAAAASLFNGTAPFEIGAQFGDGLWDGNIDNVRVYNVVLSGATITSNYASPCNVSTTGLVSQWFFNNDGLDSVGSNNLTNNNSATFSATVPYNCVAAAVPQPPQLIPWE